MSLTRRVPSTKWFRMSLDITRQLEDERAREVWEKAKLAKDILDYQREQEMQEQEDVAQYEALQAQYAQEWDDWALWSSMHPGSPTRERELKRQKMILHIQVQGDATQKARLDLDVRPGTPVMLGMSWTLVAAEALETGVEQGGTGAKGSGSQTPTERINPVTPEKLSEGVGVGVVPKQGHIAEGELTAFMLNEEGGSVFAAWSSGGFSAEQIQRLYGDHVLEAGLRSWRHSRCLRGQSFAWA